MKKNVVIVLVIVLISTAFFGCDAINSVIDSAFLDAPDVKVADLDDYSGPPVTANDAEIKKGFEYALEVLGNRASVSRLLGEDYPEFARAVSYSSPELAMFLDDSQQSRSASVGANVSISDEIVALDTGIEAKIEQFDVSGEVNVDSLENPQEIKAKFDAKVQIDLLDAITGTAYDENEYPVTVTISDMLFNFSGKGNGTATNFDTTTGEPQKVDYYSGFDLSMAFTLDATDYSGKYEVNFKYVNSAVVDMNSTEPSFSGEETLEVTVYVYDNNNDPIGEATYSESELTTIALSR